MGPLQRPRDSTRARKAHPSKKLRKNLAIPTKPDKPRTARGRLGDDFPGKIPAEVEIAIQNKRVMHLDDVAHEVSNIDPGDVAMTKTARAQSRSQ